jgi:hypothetical protein
MARALGCSSQDALLIYPLPTKIHTQYFGYRPGSNYQVGDIIVFAQPNVPIGEIDTFNGHAAYVAEIQSPNIPDGTMRMGATGIWRDDDPNPSPTDHQIILHQVFSEGGNVQIKTLAETKAQFPLYVVKGYYSVRPETIPYTVTFKNSFNEGQVYVGKTQAGDWVNRQSPFTNKYVLNTQIEAKAISGQTIGSTSYNFDPTAGWRRQRDNRQMSNVETMDVTVTASETYTANFTATAFGPVVVFQNYSDGVPIGSIIRVNGQDKTSPTNQFPVGVTAQAYSTLLANRAQYYFSQWSTGSTNTSLTPATAGTYTAHYTFGYVLEPDNIYITTTGPSNNIQLVWEKHPSPYVTQYQIWRKVRHVHNAMVVATLSNTTTSWTDYSYTISSGTNDKVIEYDIRARYVIPGVRDVWSSPNWFSVMGSGGGIEASIGFLGAATQKATEFGMSVQPNPFNPSTTLTISLVEDAHVEVEVFDLQGRVVGRLLHGTKPAGIYLMEWRAKDESGMELASGTYMVRLNAVPVSGSSPFTTTRKLLLIR